MKKVSLNFKEDIKDTFITIVSPIVYITAFIILYLYYRLEERAPISVKCDGGEGQGHDYF